MLVNVTASLAPAVGGQRWLLVIYMLVVAAVVVGQWILVVSGGD